MNKTISGLYAITPELAREIDADGVHVGANAVAEISALFAVPDVEAAARKSCQLLQVNGA
jgi:thiamine monophosphate synthase